MAARVRKPKTQKIFSKNLAVDSIQPTFRTSGVHFLGISTIGLVSSYGLVVRFDGSIFSTSLRLENAISWFGRQLMLTWILLVSIGGTRQGQFAMPGPRSTHDRILRALRHGRRLQRWAADPLWTSGTFLVNALCG